MFQNIIKLVSLAVVLSDVAQAVPVSADSTTFIDTLDKRASSWWLGNIQRRGQVAYGGNSGYQIFRNVMDFGAKGDGSTDDTQAINTAISSGNRCGQGCDSTTVTPAIVYFPPGRYVVSKPIVQYYYTQLIGDAAQLPTIFASPDFEGMAVIDADPYDNQGTNFYTNQNNFFRQIRNFNIDLTRMPMSRGAGIHWQVAQATSLQNIVFNMIRGGGQANKQQGIFMDNGSGGFMTDLTFNGGGYGAFFGSQQFTTRNLTFNGCQTAIYMNWNWLWSLKSVNIQGCAVGIDMSNNQNFNQTVGSVTLQDSSITNTPIGIKTAFRKTDNIPVGGGALIIDNVDFTGCPTAVQSNSTGSAVFQGGSVMHSWGQGRRYVGPNGASIQQPLPVSAKPAALLGPGGRIAERSKPQYIGTPASSFVSIKGKGAKGDGVTDDTAAIQNAMNTLPAGSILYFDHGAYVVSNTVNVPANIKIVGEIWSLIMAKGAAFQDEKSPKPVWRVGQPGSVGNVEMQDLMFETVGPQPGAIMMEWNVAGTAPGQAGLWDVHFRIGGSAGTQLQADKCTKNPSATHGANPACIGAALLFHATPQSSAYLENTWMWVSDHELDQASHNQIDIYNARGILIESQKATWLYGTSSEHSVFYNYALLNAKNVFMSAIQTESPYFQSNPDATTPFTAQSNKYFDPNFGTCAGSPNPGLCKKSWGLKIGNSQDVLIYGAGLYSFFENYSKDCEQTNSCQTNMVHIQNSPSTKIYGLSTFSATNMVTVDGKTQVTRQGNKSNFCDTLALWTQT